MLKLMVTVLQQKKFSIYVKRIHGWKMNKQLITELSLKPSGKYRNTLDGADRKPYNELVNNRVLEWIYEHRAKNVRVSTMNLIHLENLSHF